VSSLPLPIPLSSRVTLLRDKTRIFPVIADILAFQALVAQAWIDHTGTSEAELNETSSTLFSCLAANMGLELSLSGFKHAAMTGDMPDEIQVFTVPKPPPPLPPEAQHVAGATSLSVRLMSAAFAVAADRMVEWVEKNVTTDRHKFPPIINFGRVIRNAIVHGHTVNIRSPKAPTVTWRGLEISDKDFGRELFNGSLISGGDLVLLLMEMEAELNELGAPFELG
jgi:hypothetical protein